MMRRCFKVNCFALALLLVGGTSVGGRSAEPEPAEPRGAQLTVRIVPPPHHDGPERPPRYVGVVSETAPWREPIEEAVLPGDERSVTFTLGPGRYRTVVGSPGAVRAYGPVFEVDPALSQDHLELTVDLAPLDRVTGRVLDGSTGQPIEGARVRHEHASLPDSPTRLSPLGESLLGPQLETTTGPDGRFALAVAGDGQGSYLWVEAPGWAPRRWGPVRAPTGRPPDAPPHSLGSIALHPGGRLVVELQGPIPAGARLRLEPLEVELPEGLSPNGAAAHWTLPIPSATISSAPDGARDGGAQAPAIRSLEWPSLPSGTWSLWLHGPSRGAHRQTPVHLARLRIPGDSTGSEATRLRLDLLDFVDPEPDGGSAPSDPAPCQALITGDPLGAGNETPTLEVWRSGRATVYPVDRRSVSGGQLLSWAGEGCRQGDRLLLRGSQGFAVSDPLVRSPAGVDAAPARLTTVPAGSVRGEVTVTPGSSLPPWGFLRVEPCGPRPGARPVRGDERGAGQPLEIPVALTPRDEPRSPATASFEAPVPVGCSRLQLVAADFTPARWEARLAEPGATAELPRRLLEHGAALLARIVSTRDSLGVAEVLVEAIPEAQLRQAYEALGGGPPLVGTEGARTDDDGWVRLYGLPAGTWALRLTPPGPPSAVTGGAPISPLPHLTPLFDLVPGREALLDPVVLPPPASLEVAVTLSPGLHDEGAEAWRVLAAGDPSSPWLLTADVDPQGLARFPQLPPGRVELSGLIRFPGERPFRAGAERFEIAPGEALSRELDLALLRYRGTVSWWGQPIAGTLTLNPLDATTTDQLTVRVDEEGRFRIGLPEARAPGDERDGPQDGAQASLWLGRFTEQGGALIEVEVGPVHFDDPEDEVEIRLPTGTLSGLVVDGAGEPVEARVTLQGIAAPGSEGSRRTRPRSRTAASGRFTFEALQEGTYTLRAEARDRRSEELTVDLPADGTRSDLRLVLEEGEPFTGRLLSATGEPLAGARGLLQLPGPGTFTHIPWTSDEEGRFELRVPSSPTASAGRWHMAWTHPAATGSRWLDPGDRRGELLLRQAPGGPVRIALPARRGPFDGPGWWLVSEDGRFLPVRWAGRFTAEAWTIPSLEQGGWYLVKTDSIDEEALVRRGLGAQLPPRIRVIPGQGEMVQVEIKTNGD